jgi:ABC-type uncharacterized transport system auxiliary subunit
VAAPALPVVLRVDTLGVNAAYNRDGIAWREGPFQMGTSPAHRWMATPPRMIADLLARDLAASGRYEAVVQTVAGVSTDYALGGEIELLEADVRGQGCAARLVLRVLLVRSGREPQALLQKRYEAEEACRASGPDGFVAAMSEAVRDVSAAVQRDVYDAVSRDLEREPAHGPAVARDEPAR